MPSRQCSAKNALKASCQGNILKYVWRYQQKGGKEDLEKAKVYMGWLIDSALG